MNTEARKLPVQEENALNTNIDYSEIVKSEQFRHLLQRKRSFIIPMTIFFFVFYFTLPFMTSYSTVLNTPAIGAITWGWLFAFSQFIMTWALCIIYSKKAREFDNLVEKIIEKTLGKGGR